MISRPIAHLRECFDCDSAAGTLTWKVRPTHHFSSAKHQSQFNTRYGGKIAGGKKTRSGYWDVFVDGQKIMAHRIIWAMHTGAWPVAFIDHINRVRSDNRVCNLREATQSQNSKNRASTNQLGLKGVYPSGSKFRALIQINLGVFDTAELAHQAYATAAREIHGEFAGGISHD